jgi:hypothetical protein
VTTVPEPSSLGGVTTVPEPSERTTPVLAQLVPLQESSLALVGTLLILTIDSATNEATLESAETQAATVVVSSGTAVSVGQGPLSPGPGEGNGASGDEEPGKPEETPADQAPSPPTPWERFILRTDEALEQLDREDGDLAPRSDGAGVEQEPGSPMSDGPMGLRSFLNQLPGDHGPEPDTPTAIDSRLEAVDTAIGSWSGRDADRAGLPLCRVGETHRIFNDMNMRLVGFTHPTKEQEQRIEVSASMALATMLAGWVYARSATRRAKFRGRWAAGDRWHSIQGFSRIPLRER